VDADQQTCAPAVCAVSIMASQIGAAVSRSDRPRRPVVAAEFENHDLPGGGDLSASGNRARPPDVVSPLMLAFTTACG